MSAGGISAGGVSAVEESPVDPRVHKALEAILFVVEEPVQARLLAEVLELPLDEVVATLAALRRGYVDDQRGFVLREVAGGWRLYTAPDVAAYVEQFVLHGRSGRLSQAALETLAIVAYKQPVTRADVSEIRGVDADGAMRTLVNRDLVVEVGRLDSPGQPALYGTTTAFLERMDLGSIAELPVLGELVPPGPVPDEPSPGGYKAARREIDALEGNPR